MLFLFLASDKFEAKKSAHEWPPIHRKLASLPHHEPDAHQLRAELDLNSGANLPVHRCFRGFNPSIG